MWHLILQIFMAVLSSLLASAILNRIMASWPEGIPLRLSMMNCGKCGQMLPWHARIPGYEFFKPTVQFPCGHGLPGWFKVTALVLVPLSVLIIVLLRDAPLQIQVSALLFLYLLYPLAMIDLFTLTVETTLVVAGIVFRMGFLLLYNPDQIASMVGGLLMGAGLFVLVDLFYQTFRNRPGLGEGDAVVLGLIGAFVGWQGLLPVVVLSAMSGLIVGVPFLLIRKRSMTSPIPFVPFLAVSGLLVFMIQSVLGSQWWIWLAALAGGFIEMAVPVLEKLGDF